MNMDTEDLDLLDISDWNQTHDHLHLFDHSPDGQLQQQQHLQAMYAQHQQGGMQYPAQHGVPAVVPGPPISVGGMPSPGGTGAAAANSNNPAVLFGIKKNVIPTITTIYEPKFYEIYQAYLQHQQQFDPDINNVNPGQQHLMTLCLNNLLCFSNWSRDSTIGNWIRATLFENPDMRPEVRNGLAMILVYTFSSAKAADLRNLHPTSNATIDMFTVLMKNDSGMGIVNKTSLKIYSDPFGYFNFLKTCISGLIDASAIPENERVNNQTKKTRRGSKNRDEVEAFNYVKNSIVAMLQSPDSLQLARDRIHQILQFWHVKGKGIRNERFSSVFSLPPPPVGSSLNANPSSMKIADDNSTLASAQGEFGSRVSRTSNGSLSIDTTSMSNAYSQNQGQQGQAQGFHGMGGSSGGGSGSNVTGPGPIANASVGVNDNDTASVNSDSISSCSRSPYPSFRSSGGTNNFRYSAGATGMAATMGAGGLGVSNTTTTTERDSGGSGSFYDLSNLSKHPYMALLQAQGTMNIPVPALRFDRIGGLKWNVTSTFLYDFEALQHGSHRSAFYLVDEVKLKHYLVDLINQSQQAPPGFAENVAQGVFQLSLSYLQAAAGLSSIEKILFKSNSVLTSWSQLDFTQLKIFVDGWKLQSVHAQLRGSSGVGQKSSSVMPVVVAAGEARPQRLSNSGLPQMSSQASLASNTDDMDTSSVVSASTSLSTAIGEGFHIGSSSAASTDPNSGLARRISRRRTTGGVEMKRDLARLQQLHDMSNSSGGNTSSTTTSNNGSGKGPSLGLSFGQTQLPQSASYTMSNSSPIAGSPPFSNGLPPHMMIEPQFSPSMRESDRKSLEGRSGSSGGNSFVFTATSSPISLIDYWQSLHNNGVLSPSHSAAGTSTTNSSAVNSGSSTSSGARGMIVYERSSEVGLIVRANPKYNISEDLWCLYYPEDALEQFSHHLNNLANSGQQSNPLDYSFAAFLCTLLPQTRDIFRHLQSAQPRHGYGFASPVNSITIGYYPHHIDGNSTNPFMSISQMGPPQAPGNTSLYRTVGNIDHPFHQILSKPRYIICEKWFTMEKGNFVQEFVAGNVGGLIGISLVYPLDTAKIRLQVYPHYGGTTHVIKQMIQTDGVKSLYRGLLSPAMGFGLTFAISFSGYGHGCRMLSQYHGIDITNLSYADLTMAGAYTGFLQSPARQIVERIKSVMQIREAQGGKTPYSWSGACMADLIRKEGLRNGLFQGFSSVLLREVPQFAVYYPSYEYSKKLYSEYFSEPTVAQFFAGGTAGVIQWLPPIFWFDVLKSRMQTAPAGYYNGLWDCTRKLYAEHGPSVFFRGFVPAMFRAFPLHAVIFLSYECVMSYLKN